MPDDTEATEALIGSIKNIDSKIERCEDLGQVSEYLRGSRQFCLVVALPSGVGEDLETLIRFAETHRERAYVAYVANDMPAVDYRRLLATEAGEWFPLETVLADLPVLAARLVAREREATDRNDCLFTSFLASGGGAGNTTLVVETAAHIARMARAANPVVCILDLNLQNGNACDLLDVSPQLDLAAIATDPNRIDDELLAAFRSRTEYGVDVFGCPKYGEMTDDPPGEVIFALCNALSQRYAYVNVDMPFHLFGWAEEIVRNSDVAVVTGQFSVVSALRAAALVRHLESGSIRLANTWVAVNKYVGGFFSRSLNRSEFEAALPETQRFYIPAANRFAEDCANVGKPMVLTAPRKPVSRALEAIAISMIARRAQKIEETGGKQVDKRAKRRFMGAEW